MAETCKITQNGGRLISGVEYIDEHNYLPIIQSILKNVGNCRLTGDTGAGKTTMVHFLAQEMKKPLFETVLTRDTTRWDLLGTDILKGGETQIRKGIVLLWLESPEGGILNMEGINYAEPNIFSLMESLADFRGSIWIPELQETFHRTEKHKLIISFNPSEKVGYSGTFTENIATMRRFEGLNIEYLSVQRETMLLKDQFKVSYNWARKWVEIGSQTRNLYKEGKLCTPLTTGNLINYARMHNDGLSDEEILLVASSLFRESEIPTFTRLY